MNSIGGPQDCLLVTINQSQQGRMATWLTTDLNIVFDMDYEETCTHKLLYYTS